MINKRVVRRDRAGMEAVRMAAVELFEQGFAQAEVARLLETSPQNAHRWHKKWTLGGREALVSAGPPGRTPKIDDEELDRVRHALLAGARAHGFDQDLWTLQRIATVIERVTGVRHHPGHVWYILRDRLGWSTQRPARRAVERDGDAIVTWVDRDWPRIKKRCRTRGVDRVLQRVRTVADTDHTPQLGADRADPGAGTPVQLETRLDGRRTVLPIQP